MLSQNQKDWLTLTFFSSKIGRSTSYKWLLLIKILIKIDTLGLIEILWFHNTHKLEQLLGVQDSTTAFLQLLKRNNINSSISIKASVNCFCLSFVIIYDVK